MFNFCYVLISFIPLYINWISYSVSLLIAFRIVLASIAIAKIAHISQCLFRTQNLTSTFCQVDLYSLINNGKYIRTLFPTKKGRKINWAMSLLYGSSKYLLALHKIVLQIHNIILPRKTIHFLHHAIITILCKYWH